MFKIIFIFIDIPFLKINERIKKPIYLYDYAYVHIRRLYYN